MKGLSKTDWKQIMTKYECLQQVIMQVKEDPHQFMLLKQMGINKVRRLRQVF